MKHTNTKLMREVAKRFFTLEHPQTLEQCYDSYSVEKARAFNYCKELQSKYNGVHGRVISFNTFCFAYAFVGTIENRKAFFYITRYYDRFVYLDEIGL